MEKDGKRWKEMVRGGNPLIYNEASTALDVKNTMHNKKRNK